MRRLALLSFLLAASSVLVSAAVDQGLLALVPSGSKLIGGIDMDHAKTSPLWQYFASKTRNDNNKDFAEFVQRTGFDPRRDLQQVLFATSGPSKAGQAERTTILGRGNFDQSRVVAAARQKGLATHTFQGVELFVDKSDSKGPNTFAFLGDGIGVMGDLESVKDVIANRSGANPIDAALAAKIAKTAEENDVWFVSFVPGSEVANHLNPASTNEGQNKPNGNQGGWPQAQALESVQQASGGVQFGDMVRLRLDAVTRSAKDATSLADVVRFFASMVQMQRQKDPRAAMAAEAFDKMEIETDGERIHLAVAFPEKGLEQLIDSAPAGTTAFDFTQHKQ